MGSKLLEVVSKPGALGLREKLNEDRAGWAIRSWYICREGVETTTWPQLPQAGVIRHRIRASEEGPSFFFFFYREKEPGARAQAQNWETTP